MAEKPRSAQRSTLLDLASKIQGATFSLTVEVGRLQQREMLLGRALKGWIQTIDANNTPCIALPITPELLALLPSKESPTEGT
jgi:hypothetical protein